MREHLLIAGTGRAGTSFLVRYLTGLGLDTHLSRHGGAAFWNDDAHAGLEDIALIDPAAMPTVIKSPSTFEFIAELLAEPRLRLRAAILPVRDLRDVAASRTILERQAMHAEADWMTRQETVWESWAHTPGGVLFSLSGMDQARLLAVGFHHLVERLVAAEVPIVFLSFPRLVEDADYLFGLLRPLLPDETTIEAARGVHASLADRAKVRVGAVQVASTSLAGPSDEVLDRMALKRELAKTRAALAASLAEAAARDEPAPAGSSTWLGRFLDRSRGKSRRAAAGER